MQTQYVHVFQVTIRMSIQGVFTLQTNVPTQTQCLHISEVTSSVNTGCFCSADERSNVMTACS
jgi:hypothetical protein